MALLELYVANTKILWLSIRYPHLSMDQLPSALCVSSKLVDVWMVALASSTVKQDAFPVPYVHRCNANLTLAYIGSEPM